MIIDCKHFEKYSVNDCPKLNDSRLETLPGDPETVCRISHVSRIGVQKSMINTELFDGVLSEELETV